MRRPKDKNRDIKLRGQFIPVFFETRRTPAWKAMSMGARELYMALRCAHYVSFTNNNGRVFLSERDALEELGATNRESIRRWFRELEHFGFILKTAEYHLGVEGKGKAAQWRLTELEAPLADPKEPTCDYKKWNGTPFNGNQAWRGRGPKPKKQNPGRETTSRVDAKQRPVLDAKQRPLRPRSGRETTSISAPKGGRETTSISRLTIWGGVGGSLMKEEQDKLPWSTPTLTELTDPDEVQVIRLAIAELEKAA